MAESNTTIMEGELGENILPPSSEIATIHIDRKQYLLLLYTLLLCIGPLQVWEGLQYIPATSFGSFVEEGKDPEKVVSMFRKDDVWTDGFLSCKSW